MSIIDAIWNAIIGFWDQLKSLTQKVFDSFKLMIQDFFLWIVDQLLELVTFILSAFDLTAITNSLPVLSSIPDEVLNMLGLIGFAQCMVIIGGALIIRLFLQLIPFVRLGS